MSDSHSHHQHSGSTWALTLGALGVVFGDIGTSPLYTLKECALHARQHSGGVLDREDLFGILSLIFWAMTLVVTVKYLFFIMRAENNGEGGIFALLALVPKKMRATERGHVQGLHFAARHVAAHGFAAGADVFAFRRIGFRTIERRRIHHRFGNGDIEALPELLQLFFVQLLLAMGDVPAFAGLTEAVALNRLGEDDGGLALGLGSALEGLVDLDGIVSAAV